MRIGLFGGSFDPIHRGHVEPVRQAKQLLGLDRVIFLPTAQPPHKRGRQMASAQQRYTMVELALLHEDGLVASPHELTAGKPAYTAETLDHFRREMPDAELFLLIGSDSFADLPSWHRYQDIVHAARLVVLRRPGWEPATGSFGDHVEMPLIEPQALSSTELRVRLERGEPLPPGSLAELVVDFIAKYNLYR